MANSNELREGMQVYGANNQAVGQIESITGSGFMVNGQTITREMIARVEANKVYLTEAEQEIRVSLAEEQLNVGKRAVEAGAVRVHKEVVQEQVNVPVELRHEEAHIEKIDTPDRPLRQGETAFQEQTFEVKLRGEEAVVSKEAIVTGEVVVNKSEQVEKRQVSDTIRKERAEVEQLVDGSTTIEHNQPKINERA